MCGTGTSEKDKKSVVKLCGVFVEMGQLWQSPLFLLFVILYY